MISNIFQKKTSGPPKDPEALFVVKAVRVELTSENKSTEFSPSADGSLCFGTTKAHRRDSEVPIPLVLSYTGSFKKVFLHSRRRDLPLQVKAGRRAIA